MRILRLLGILALIGITAFATYFYSRGGGEQRDILSFIPPDFVYAIESDQPIKDWQDLSKSKVWRYLKETPYFLEISESADYLDTLLIENKTVANFVKLGDLVISAHMVSRENYDFIYLIDLRKTNLGKMREILGLLFKSFEYDVSVEKYFGIDIYELYDPEEQEILYLSIMDNILISSYDPDLIRKGIAQSENPSIRNNEDFTFVREQTNRDELYTLYLNYSVFEKLLAAFTSEIPESLQGLDEIISFSSFDLEVKDDKTVFSGYMKQLDSVPSFLSVFKDVGKGRLHAQNVLPAETALYTSIGFDEFIDFYSRLENYYKTENPAEFEDLNKQKERIEKLLKISFEDDFFSWMTDEVATAVVRIDTLREEYAYYALLHFDNYEKTKSSLDYVVERIKKTLISPIKFTETDYKGFPIKYLELKGFFKLFFKKLFNQIEKPHYTYLDDYVVFSNDPESLQFLIDAYLSQNLLSRNDSYKKFIRNFDGQSNIYTYIQNEEFYPYFYQTLDPESKKSFQGYESYLMSFPQVGLQISPSSGMYKTLLMAEFAPLEVEE